MGGTSIAENITLSSGQKIIVSAGQTSTGVTVLSGGTEIVLSGGTTVSTVVSSGGTLEVYPGYATSALSLLPGATFEIGTGLTQSNYVVSSGVTLEVAAGAVASGTVVSSGGLDYVYGSTTGSLVASGGAAYVLAGGALNGATLSGGLIEIASGATVDGSPIAFTSAGGTLQLDDSQHFGGTIAGFGVPGSIDLRDIAFGSATALHFTEAAGTTSGTLTVNDGTHTANILLLGQYATAQFTQQSDGAGGTLITDPPLAGLNGSPFLAPNHA